MKRDCNIKFLSELAHNFGVGFGVFFGVILTVFGWFLYDKFDQAEVELNKTKMELEKLEAERNANRSSNISISTSVHEAGSGSAGLIITVTLENRGFDRLVYDLSGEEVVVRELQYKGEKVASNKKWSLVYLEEIGYGDVPSTQIAELILLPGNKRELVYFVQLERENYYYITFQVPVPEDFSRKVGGDKQYTWFASKYLYIE